jgi:hypothetical protein
VNNPWILHLPQIPRFSEFGGGRVGVDFSILTTFACTPSPRSELTY